MAAFVVEWEKLAKVKTPLLEHQQRVVDRISQDDQPGLVVVHGLGSGKTLTSIAAQEALGTSSDIVAPAALLSNYAKERKKHLTGHSQSAHMLSMQNMATKGVAPARPLMIVDEAHRARDPSTSTFQTLRNNTASKRLLLTGSPFYNHPSDIAPLVNLAADSKVLPYEKEDFARRYITEKIVKPSVYQQARNIFRKDEDKVRAGSVPMLYDKMAPELQGHLAKWVDYHPGSTDEFPDVKHEDVRVPMSSKQMKVYDTLMDKAPAWVAAKVKRGLPPNKRESQQLNAFLSGVRQASNTTSPFIGPEDGAESPKIQAAFAHMQKMLSENERAKGVVYSNYLDAGIAPYKQRLQEAGIPFGEFTGEMPRKKREQLVKDYNENKIRALLLSSAGGEGLDLKGTRLLQILEPHWNDEKLKQVEGRGARYKSHSDLPKEEQKMLVERYLATRPEGLLTGLGNKILGRAPDKSSDEYLAQMSKSKEDLINQFRALLPQEHKKAKTAAKNQTTEESRELASSWKPRIAAEVSHTLPLAVWGHTVGNLLYSATTGRRDPVAGIAGGVAGAALGHLISEAMLSTLVRTGKEQARDAVRHPEKEIGLRENAKKLELKPMAKDFAGRSISTMLPNLGWLNSSPSGKAVLRHLGPAVAADMAGTVAEGYLNKYRKMIAVNELDNVRAAEEGRDAERLARLRRQVSSLETRVEGDGWKKREEPVETAAPKPQTGKVQSKKNW